MTCNWENFYDANEETVYDIAERLEEEKKVRLRKVNEVYRENRDEHLRGEEYDGTI